MMPSQMAIGIQVGYAKEAVSALGIEDIIIPRDVR
jgi:hypothetical protein